MDQKVRSSNPCGRTSRLSIKLLTFLPLIVTVKKLIPSINDNGLDYLKAAIDMSKATLQNI